MLTKGLKVVALISGGKDSCYNMVQCVAEGHTIVALANLRPKDKDELDSYMFQTVGHHVIDLYGQAMGLPLYRRTLEGTSLEQGADYSRNPQDEVEDLYELLKEVKEKEGVNAVSVGAILSDYQRVRVENVCVRLGLTPLAYLWRRAQEELLAEMVSAGVHALLIKVAALGLDPHKHLGRSLAQIYPHMITMRDRFGLNVCGEGGEYETFTLDCTLFKKRIVIDKQELVMHSDDTIAPVGYLNFLEAHLEDKEVTEETTYQTPTERNTRLLEELFPEGIPEELDSLSTETCCDRKSMPELASPPKSYCHVHCTSSGHFWVTGVMGWATQGRCIKAMTSQAMDDLANELRSVQREMKDLAVMYLYVRNMEEFALVNDVYKQYFSINPPARVCLEVALPSNVGLRLACYGYRPPGGESEGLCRSTMHVQGLSHWAPANIGPYSQAVRLGETVWVAGQIGMVPANLDVVAGLRAQCRLSLRHVERVLAAMRPGAGLHHVLVGVCYVTLPTHATTAREQWEAALKGSADEEDDLEWEVRRPPPSVLYVTVPRLPKGALVEWQVCAATRDQVHSGSLTLNSESLLSTLEYRYIPAPHHLMSYTLTIDTLSEKCPDTEQYHEGFRLAHTALTTACHRLSEEAHTEVVDVFRSVQVFYTQSRVSEDQLNQDLQQLPSSPCVLPAPLFVPVIDLNSPTRIMTLCS